MVNKILHIPPRNLRRTVGLSHCYSRKPVSILATVATVATAMWCSFMRLSTDKLQRGTSGQIVTWAVRWGKGRRTQDIKVVSGWKGRNEEERMKGPKHGLTVHMTKVVMN